MELLPAGFPGDIGPQSNAGQAAAGREAAALPVCDRALLEIVDYLEPRLVVGIGRWSEGRARAVLGDRVAIGHVLHPSPASPAANRGWEDAAETQLRSLGLAIP